MNRGGSCRARPRKYVSCTSPVVTRTLLAYKSSLGMLPPLSASFCNTVLYSHTFICAESPIFSFLATRLLSRPKSFIRSTIEVFQFSFSLCAAASPSSFATTSTPLEPTGAVGDGADAACGAGVAYGAEEGEGGGGGAVPSPSFSMIEPNSPVVNPFCERKNIEALVDKRPVHHR